MTNKKSENKNEQPWMTEDRLEEIADNITKYIIEERGFKPGDSIEYSEYKPFMKEVTKTLGYEEEILNNVRTQEAIYFDLMVITNGKLLREARKKRK